jgi:hypothetical protein
VVIRGPAPQSGAYGIVPSVPGCRAAACPAGFLVLKQAALPDTATSASAAPPAPPMPPPGVGTAPPATGADDAEALAVLAKLAVTARDAARARERMAAPVIAPTVTDASTAPGRPSASGGSAPPGPPAGTQSAQRTSSGQAAAASDSCQTAAQQYATYARTAGSPESMPQLYSMYQYLQCNCGYPPSPQLPPCSQ